jgi:hypothetical protein
MLSTVLAAVDRSKSVMVFPENAGNKPQYKVDDQ